MADYKSREADKIDKNNPAPRIIFANFLRIPVLSAEILPFPFKGVPHARKSDGPSPRDGSVLRKSFNRSALPSRDRVPITSTSSLKSSTPSPSLLWHLPDREIVVRRARLSSVKHPSDVLDREVHVPQLLCRKAGVYHGEIVDRGCFAGRLSVRDTPAKARSSGSGRGS